MAQASLDQAEELTPNSREVSQKTENVSFSQHEDGDFIKLDPYGLPLSPQPSQWKDDPLVGPHPPSALDLQY